MGYMLRAYLGTLRVLVLLSFSLMERERERVGVVREGNGVSNSSCKPKGWNHQELGPLSYIHGEVDSQLRG